MSKQTVFYVEYYYGDYDGSSIKGVASTLEKAVEYCQNSMKEYENLQKYDIESGKGYLITECILDELNDNNAFTLYHCDGTLFHPQ